MSESFPAAAGARQPREGVRNLPEDISFADGRKKKRSSGIVGLNLLLDGGFPPGTLIMVYGSPVAGIDIAARQFWRGDGGDDGTYLMNDGDPDVGMVNVGDVHPSMYQDWLMGNRMVIDSLSSMVIKYGIDGTLAFLRQAREEIRQTGANIMFLVYTGVHQPMDMTRLMRISDIVIEFTTEVHQAEIERTLAVQKIRKAAAPQRLLPFIITDNGIEASTTSRVV
ncbi:MULTISPECIES: ATPase domain-containing protein [unclassified Methanoregula]|uniref:RAD55 family ATPase n=1 Tax=unclassified Methanoregula TaxID=2649730 RepID=UPI0009CAB487|nr:MULTISPECIES: ATPase domain-containing protein [unclassified Methanoregula]OPX63168.1 MAG: circadian clock protein KaiC [Methanoregula sp. PtaB.Bin085]OPY33468.1 MAG: circadian clock protein KaiC [Methanoregula sp. PtaU1.Bin006]